MGLRILSNKRIGQPGRRAIAFIVTAVLSAGFLLLASSPQPTEAATVRCFASRTITMPSHSAVLEVEEPWTNLSQAMYGLPFPDSCQSRIKIGTYSIDVTITYSLKLTSATGGGINDSTWLELSLGTVGDTHENWSHGGAGGVESILTSGLGPAPRPSYNSAGVDLAGDLDVFALVANCFPSACSGKIRAVGTFNFASLDTVLAVYALTWNCVGLELPGQPFCGESYGSTYLPGLEGATLRLSATAVLIPLYETSR